MKVVLLCEGENELKLSLDAAKFMLKWLPQRYGFNRVIYKSLKQLINSSESDTLILNDKCFKDPMFRTNPSFIEVIEKFKIPIYNIIDIPCNFFNIKKDQECEKVTYPDLSYWYKGHTQEIDTYIW